MVFIHCALKIKVGIMPVVQLFIKSEKWTCIFMYFVVL